MSWGQNLSQPWEPIPHSARLCSWPQWALAACWPHQEAGGGVAVAAASLHQPGLVCRRACAQPAPPWLPHPSCQVRREQKQRLSSLLFPGQVLGANCHQLSFFCYF